MADGGPSWVPNFFAFWRWLCGEDAGEEPAGARGCSAEESPVLDIEGLVGEKRYMWDRRKLEDLAAQEARAFQDPRWDRIYLAMERYSGTTHEKLIEKTEAQRELDAALDAVSYDDIKKQITGTPVDAFFDRMRQTKQVRDQERQQQTTPAPDHEPDDEPEQKM